MVQIYHHGWWVQEIIPLLREIQRRLPETYSDIEVTAPWDCLVMMAAIILWDGYLPWLKTYFPWFSRVLPGVLMNLLCIHPILKGRLF